MLTRLLLICVLVVTSLGLGAARGQLRLGGEVVLCAGGAVLVVQTGPDGAPPVRHSSVCPDMAPLFLAGFAAPPPALPQRVARIERPVAVPGPAVVARAMPGPQAHGPPVAARA